MRNPLLKTGIIFNPNKAHKMQSNCFYETCEDINMSFDILRRVQKFSDDKWHLLIK